MIPALTGHCFVFSLPVTFEVRHEKATYLLEDNTFVLTITIHLVESENVTITEPNPLTNSVVWIKGDNGLLAVIAERHSEINNHM